MIQEARQGLVESSVRLQSRCLLGLGCHLEGHGDKSASKLSQGVERFYFLQLYDLGQLTSLRNTGKMNVTLMKSHTLNHIYPITFLHTFSYKQFTSVAQIQRGGIRRGVFTGRWESWVFL